MVEIGSEKSYGWFDRFLFYSLPVLFTLLLTGVLLTVFGYDVLNELLRAGNKLPVISAVLPEPKLTDAQLKEALKEAAQEADNETQLSAEEAAALRSSVKEKQAQLVKLGSENKQKNEEIASLKEKLQELQAQVEKFTADDKEYEASIDELADVYANMSPSKAAPVIQSLTLNERVLVLHRMKRDDQVAILEKMDPKTAAETSIMLKDVVPVKDREIAALQERLELNEQQLEAGAGEGLTKNEVSETFAKMAPDKAAAVLLEMSNSNLTQAVTILRLMESGARAAILNALSELSEKQTAKITAKLG